MAAIIINWQDQSKLDNRMKRLLLTTIYLWYPTNPFTILEPLDQEIGEFYVVQERHATDLDAPKLWKGSSGT